VSPKPHKVRKKGRASAPAVERPPRPPAPERPTVPLLRVEEGPERFAPLVEAARALGLRVGWLEFAPPAPLPDDLARAAALGVLRAVAVGDGRSAAVKPLRGEPVLRDLLREHFRGCALVLLRAPQPPLGPAAPDLAPDGDAWRVAVDGAARRYGTAELAAALRKPRPFT
jgi:hypothetical protein